MIVHSCRFGFAMKYFELSVLACALPAHCSWASLNRFYADGREPVIQQVLSEEVSDTEEDIRLAEIEEHRQCARVFMDSFFAEVTVCSKNDWISSATSHVILDRKAVEQAEAALTLGWGDSANIVSDWLATELKLKQFFEEVYSYDKLTWRMADMYEEKECENRIPEEIMSPGCKLDFVGGYRAQAIGHGSFGSVYAAQPGEGCKGYGAELVVKYSSNCEHFRQTPEERYKSLDDADGLLSEYAILKMIEEKGIAPKAYSISAPSVPRSEKAWNKDARFRRPERPCHSQKAMVRAIVQDKVSLDVEKFFATKKSRDTHRMRLVIRAGKDIILLLRKLHNSGFIHGDVHSGNVAATDPEGSKFVLIDFGMAKFFPAEMAASVDRNIEGGPKPGLLSPWHLDNLRVGRRDDIFRAFDIVAKQLTFGAPFLKEVSAVGNDLRAFKRNTPYFTFIYTRGGTICGMYPSVGQEQCQAAMESLDKALDLVRETPHPNARPKYEDIISHFDSALGVLEQLQSI
jgi:serine/threonine protein kinase